MYWECLLEELPVLYNDPTIMRFHELTDIPDGQGDDHLLFWPIGQQMLAELVRKLLNRRIEDPENPTYENVKTALKGLNQLEWRLHQVPWKYFLLVGTLIEGTNQLKWTMRNEEREWAVRTGRRMQLWLLGLEEDDEKYVENLKSLWKSFLRPSQPDENVEKMWEQILQMKKGLSG
ncbi:hypothetical protein JT359_06865 [Candidatus Poribacteria bacterium]|nr:hypothetical protein [Candidatus Poribacteria bacterium]